MTITDMGMIMASTRMTTAMTMGTAATAASANVATSIATATMTTAIMVTIMAITNTITAMAATGTTMDTAITTTTRTKSAMSASFDWIHDPAEIYRQSFATIRAEVDLAAFPPDLVPVAVRVVHACGMTDVVSDLAFSAQAAQAGRQALAAGAPILVDAEMVSHGIIRRHLPCANPVICTLNDADVPERAKAAGTTRSAMAVEKWLPSLAGAVVAIGNAPTALFRLLELVRDGAPPPAVILGFAVGFVGAAESKEALIASGLPHVAVRGRRGGSAMAAAAVNALAGGLE